MSSSDYEGEEGGEGVIGRKLIFCPRLQTFETTELVRTCECCSDFFVYCCGCQNQYENDGRHSNGRICHHFRLIFVDGACSQNGQTGATAGVGIACGASEKAQHSIPIVTDWDPNQKRTSQRAELLAAQAGLRYLAACEELNKTQKAKRTKSNTQGPESSWIIATDSEYVAKGMTEWLPQWKKNNFRNARNMTPANLDLFLDLDEELAAEETKRNVKIGFWHVRRKYNTIADGLAKKAASKGDPE